MSTENNLPTDNVPSPQPSPADGMTAADWQDTSPFSSEMSAKLAESLKLHTKLDPAVVDAAMKASGVETTPDGRTDAQKIFDRAYGLDAGKDPNMAEMLPAMTPQERAGAAAEWTEFSKEMNFPNEIARSVVDLAHRAASKQAGMSETERTAWRNEQQNQLAQSFSPGDLAKWLPVARAAISATTIGEDLMTAGAFHDAASLRLVMMHLMHLEQRPKA